ncbi:ester cyclase [Amycolatopsis sp. OK19-0408]|uniref:Ester cyclase n=1 Tax=Amycolatopsis iheyensis TaxID=2945988 RepID=A0A9X2NPJ2_9PSEU|nr:ester cyclase [Amycolatopsis iheyensis]MCR6490774.1 ester cyclase [Amycolatopsis iheyensis]
MVREQNIATQEKAAELINSGNTDAGVLMMFAEDAVDHDPAPGQARGRDGFRDFFRTLFNAFPDAHLEPATLVADDDHVCLAYTLTGTHQGEFQGVAATGKEIEVRGVQIGRFENGQIVERWGSTDELGILRQLGVTS